MRTNKKTQEIMQLVIAILLCQAAGLIGSLFTSPNIDVWYSTLAKPDFNPPSWLFAPVWTILYALMGIALYLVWRKRDRPYAKLGLYLFAVQLALNAYWSFIFFEQKLLFAAFVEIVLLLITIVLTTVVFWRVEKIASLAMLPYIGWVTFAMFLNFSLFLLN